MGNPNRNRARGSKEQPALQLSSYQLVMAICALLLLMCALFIAGILVQRFTGDSGSAPVASNSESAEIPERVPAGTAASQGEGRQVAPRPVTLPAESEKTGSSTGASGSSARRSESNAKYIPAPPPRRDRNDVTSTKPDTPNPETSTQTAAKEAPPVTQPATVPATPAMPVEPAAPETATTEPEPTPAETSSPADPVETSQPATTSAAGPFTIQVASFDSNNLDRAKRFKDDTEKATDFTVNLVPSTDGKHVRALVGEYKDRVAAESARDAMRKVKGFEDCFVKSLAEE
ncbi:MAG: hypothetical protein AMXMBFR82_13220 [Candidatus Hydrogenedentota bacterium]